MTDELTPRSLVAVRTGGGYLVLTEPETVLAAAREAAEGDGLVKLDTVTYEGHRLATWVDVTSITAVAEMTEERWRFELARVMERAGPDERPA